MKYVNILDLSQRSVVDRLQPISFPHCVSVDDLLSWHTRGEYELLTTTRAWYRTSILLW